MPHIPEHLARGHRTSTQSAEQLGRKVAETFALIGGLDGSSRVLDIGCGPGRMAAAIGERFSWSNRLHGFDINRADIDYCRSSITAASPNFTFDHVDIRNDLYNPSGKVDPTRVTFPCDTAVVDFAFATSIFTHFAGDELRRYCSEARRCIMPGGVFVSSYFLLTPDAEAAIEAGGARFSFPHPIGVAMRVEHLHAPRKVVAFEAGFVMAALRDAGFSDLALTPGAWSGAYPSGRHSQDYIVAR